MNLIHRLFTPSMLLIFGLINITPASAATPESLLLEYARESKKTIKDFSAEAGRKIFLTEHKTTKGETASCTHCHTKDPKQSGKTRAGKVIDPMAVIANKERFTDRAKVEKWFKRNCKDVFERECTAQEKGDFITYMKSVK